MEDERDFDGFKTPIPIKIVLDKVYSSHTQKWPEIWEIWQICGSVPRISSYASLWSAEGRGQRAEGRRMAMMDDDDTGHRMAHHGSTTVLLEWVSRKTNRDEMRDGKEGPRGNRLAFWYYE